MNKMRAFLWAVLVLCVGLSESRAVECLPTFEQIQLTSSIDVRGNGYGNGNHKVPKKSLEVALLDNTLFLYGQFGNAQLVIRSVTESHSIHLSGGEESVTLPNLPGGVYELLVYDEVCTYRGELHIS